MAKIQVVRGTYDETCTLSTNLVANQVKFPAIRDVIQYTEQRMLSTLIVSGAKDMSAVGYIPTKIGKIPDSKLIGANAYKYPVMGRIQRASVINNQVGSSGSDGTFALSMADNVLTNGTVAVFNGNNLQARVMGTPSGTPGNYIYTFQTLDGTTFSYATHVAGQSGTKTCFGSFSAFEERSLRGYGSSFYPDFFVNHLTIQRKTVAISGSAATDILWVNFNGTRGWMFEKERQARLQFMMEDEFAKWFAPSTMKSLTDGTLLTSSRLRDPISGNEIITGDGIIPQIAGVNEAYGSDSDGSVTLNDINDMMTTLEKKSNSVDGKQWYVITGTDGYQKAQSLLETKAHNTFNITMYPEGNKAVIGGQQMDVGYNFNTYNVNGNQVVFVKHPLFDDEQRFTERGSDGKLLQSSMMVFLDMGTAEGQANIEILGKGVYGVNRTMVSAYLNGITGLKEGNVVSSVDGLEFDMLKEDGIFIYNTTSCGIIRKSS